jgi:hypothetical protein
MRNFVLVALSLVVSVSVAMAQSKVDTKWHCLKATTEDKLDVGDAPDHIYWIGQGTCDAASSSGDLKEKTGTTRNSTMHGKRPSTSTATSSRPRTMATR